MNSNAIEINGRYLLKLMRNRKHIQSEILKPLLYHKLISLTLPDKPNSPKQKYRTTEKGKKLLEMLRFT